MKRKPCPDCADASAQGFPGRVRQVRGNGLCAPCNRYAKYRRWIELEQLGHMPLPAWGGKAAKFRPRVRRRRR